MARFGLFALTTFGAIAFAGGALTPHADAQPSSRTAASGHEITGQERFLRDGGSVRLTPEASRRGSHGRKIPISDPGDRGISGIDQLSGGGALEDYREDNLGTTPDMGSTNEREDFVEDGGTMPPAIVKRNGVEIIRETNIAQLRHVIVKPARISERGSFAFITADVDDHEGDTSFAGSADGLGVTISRPLSQPKIIDVARERLDRRQIPPEGIEIIWHGGAKIIRIAHGYTRRDASDSLK
ncbi:hypothetical protein LQ948_17575 [Jiella sp. MQZ9-1]|uniref:Uncharacterized protein n=1 Tax=Jiella flava TaxID=2816857 RepID=A0A939JYG4_9HYPH|nr:hypothetical protein [Jiella flava]MBO0664386.1 hypothetical protein [Jiella flava]MCD2473021.1 hypothetical protein [Jiella flava]